MAELKIRSSFKIKRGKGSGTKTFTLVRSGHFLLISGSSIDIFNFLFENFEVEKFFSQCSWFEDIGQQGLKNIDQTHF